MLRCPKTSVLVMDPEGRDAIRLQDFKDLHNPVMIRGDNDGEYEGGVYELKDILDWFKTSKDQETGHSTSPGTRRLCTAMDLEPVRYPSFQGYAETIRMLRIATNNTWRPSRDAAGDRSVEETESMEPPQQWQLHPFNQRDIDELRGQYVNIQELYEEFFYENDSITSLRKNIFNLREKISHCQGGVLALQEFVDAHNYVAKLHDERRLLFHDEQCLTEKYLLFQDLLSIDPTNSDNFFSNKYSDDITEIRRNIGIRRDGPIVLRNFDAIISTPVDNEDIQQLRRSYFRIYDLMNVRSERLLDPIFNPPKNEILEIRKRIAIRQDGLKALRPYDGVHDEVFFRYMPRVDQQDIRLLWNYYHEYQRIKSAPEEDDNPYSREIRLELHRDFIIELRQKIATRYSGVEALRQFDDIHAEVQYIYPTI